MINGEDSASGVRSVACGGGFTCATDSNAVRCWGHAGGYGSLGVADLRKERVSDPGDRGAIFAEVFDLALRILG